MKIGWISLGCPKNQVDTEYLIGMMGEEGYAYTSDPGSADILVINTCSFIQTATQESIDTILEFAQFKQGNCKLLVVVGCFPQRYGQELVAEIPEVDLWLGTGEYSRLPELIKSKLKEENTEKMYLQAPAGWLPPEFENKPISTPPYRAYVKIAEGCDNRCLYCIIPQLKGRYRSRKPETILKEVKALLAKGVKEITLVAQDTTAYGQDLPGENNLAQLLSSLDKLEGEFWLRILYTYPSRITDQLLKVIKDSKHICHYLDIPLQHVSPKVLQRMGRRTAVGEIKQMLERIKKLVPDMAIRTTFILGYPGETEEEFREVLSFLEEYRLDWVGVFPYFREEGTPAAKLHSQVHHATKKRRAREVLEKQQAISSEKNKELIGEEIVVMLEEQLVNSGWTGRSYREAPEIDGVFKLEEPEDNKIELKPGSFVIVEITGAEAYQIYGKIKRPFSKGESFPDVEHSNRSY
jgi:ribosomal protein S12 methylthiotransferase